MSQQVFQKMLARLVVDPDFRDLVRSTGSPAFDGELTDLERKRLLALVDDPGVTITKTLHKGFRLGKILSMLPLTCQILGGKRLGRELKVFWRTYASRSFYYIDEAVAFCSFLETRPSAMRIAYLPEIVAYERARLELQRPRVVDSQATSVEISFSHDPELLLTTLAKKSRPRRIPARPCKLSGSLESDGSIQWVISDTTA
jgi:hypothetical protein